MRVVCAPDSFKGSLTALEAAEAMARGVWRVFASGGNSGRTVEVDLCPIADGGEGTVQTLVDATGGQLHRATVPDPLGRTIPAQWGLVGATESTTAIVEMAAASGLTLLGDDERDPTRTSTFGTGRLIRAAIDGGAGRVVLGIGGSATNDGGCGAAQALGVRFFDADDDEMRGPITGADLLRIARIDPAGSLDVPIELCCDVDNPLTGGHGAAAIYGPQKGASPDQVVELDRGLLHIGGMWRDQLGVDVFATPGAGAAGGMGGGMIAMLGATLRRGIDLVLETIDFDARIAGADLCLVGEGRLDAQTATGKACAGVARAAQNRNVPVHGFFGSIADDAPDLGLTSQHAFGDVMTNIDIEESMERASELLEARVFERLSEQLRR